MAVRTSSLTFLSLLHDHERLVIIENLSKISLSLVDVCKYLELNITATRKILKKGDKKFKDTGFPQAVHFIERRLFVNESALKTLLSY